MLIGTLRNRLRLWTLILSLSLLLGVFVVAQTTVAQGTDEDYDVTILAPYSTFLAQDQEIAVRVRTLQGAPAHGVPVRFHLAPEWQGKAQIVPEETTTEHGIARARVRAVSGGGSESRCRKHAPSGHGLTLSRDHQSTWLNPTCRSGSSGRRRAPARMKL